MTQPSEVTLPNPELDGVDHINVYSRGKTELGRNLSNFAHMHFKHPTLGYFSSVEAFWYYIKTGCKHEHLRRLFGAFAKASGEKLPIVEMEKEEFHRLVREAITCKIEQNTTLLDAVIHNELPLKHYYVYGQGEKAVIREQHQHYWQLEHINAITLKWINLTNVPMRHPDE